MSKRIYVGNLPFSFTSKDLEELFSKFGSVSNAVIENDKKTETSRGTVVMLIDEDEIDSLIKNLDGKIVLGNKLHVSQKLPRA